MTNEEQMIAEKEMEPSVQGSDEFDLSTLLKRVSVGTLAEEIFRQLPKSDVILLLERLGEILGDEQHG